MKHPSDLAFTLCLVWLIIIALRVTNHIDWSWVVVLSMPLWVPPAVAVAVITLMVSCGLVIGVCAAVYAITKTLRQK